MIIAYSGKKGSGKNTFSNLIKEELSGVVKLKEYSLAKILKDECSLIYKIDRESFDDRDLKDSALAEFPARMVDDFSRKINNVLWKQFRTFNGKLAKNMHGKRFLDSDGVMHINGEALYHTPRTLCILLGSLQRSINPEFWLEKLTKEISKDMFSGEVECAAITDVRYRNEIYYLIKNFETVYSIRMEKQDLDKSNDASETDLDGYVDWDEVVYNDGSLEDLKSIAHYVATDILSAV